jgi:hypothetical protein
MGSPILSRVLSGKKVERTNYDIYQTLFSIPRTVLDYLRLRKADCETLPALAL